MPARDPVWLNSNDLNPNQQWHTALLQLWALVIQLNLVPADELVEHCFLTCLIEWH